MCKNNEKEGPSGMSQNEAFSLPENWGGHNYLLKVDVAVIHELKEAMGGDEILEFFLQSFLSMHRLHMILWELWISTLKMYGMYFVACILLYFDIPVILLFYQINSPISQEWLLIILSAQCVLYID